MTEIYAIWAFAIIAAIVAVYLIRFLNQLTKVAQEGESVLRQLNTRLPRLLDQAEKVILKADATITRVNDTLDDLDEPIRYVRATSRFISEAKYFALSKITGGASMFGAGFKAARIIFDNLRKHFAHKKDAQEDAPVE
jgi:uncharacterized protein YoxC